MKTTSIENIIPDDAFESVDDYYFPDDLRNAVRVAYVLEMPLLVTGDPGTGKTKLAYAVAKALGNKPIYRFNTKSISVYKDLLYSYDYLRHYMLIQQKVDIGQELDDYQKQGIFRFEALGKAFIDENESVVLIDEIDKAPRDFPNDLLDVMEEGEFWISELNKVIKNKGKKPFIIITSNQEKTLPDPFLRRCVFYNIPYPSDDDMFKIIEKHLGNLIDEKNKEKVEKAIKFFNKEIRTQLDEKKPATAELISWLRFLIDNNVDLSVFEDQNFSEHKKILKASISILAKTESDYKKLVYLMLKEYDNQ